MSDEITTSDGRRPGFYWCDNRVMSAILAQVGPFGCAVYTAIAIRANSDNVAWPGLKRLAEDSGMSERKAQQVVAELCKFGVLKVEERKTDSGRDLPRIYRLITPSDMGAQHAPMQDMHPSRVQEVRGEGAGGAGGGCTPCTQTRLKEQEPREQGSPAVAGDARARTRPQSATAAAAAAPAAEGPLGAMFAALCRAAGRSPQDVTSGIRAQLDQLAARLLELPEAERPDEDALRKTYRATMEAISRQQRREATPLTVGQYRDAIFSRIETARQEAADRQRQAEKALRDAEAAARWLQERAAASASLQDGPGLGPDGREAWRRIASDLRSRMGAATWDQWLAAAKPVAFQDRVLTVMVANTYAVDWITQRLAAPLASLTEELGLEDLRFVPQELAREVRAA